MELLTPLLTPPIGDALVNDISRIVAIWRGMRGLYGSGGLYLFGAFSNADAVFAPVATRFRTYGVDLGAFGDDGSASAYAETILALPEMAEWTEGAQAETEAQASALIPERPRNPSTTGSRPSPARRQNSSPARGRLRRDQHVEFYTTPLKIVLTSVLADQNNNGKVVWSYASNGSAPRGPRIRPTRYLPASPRLIATSLLPR